MHCNFHVLSHMKLKNLLYPYPFVYVILKLMKLFLTSLGVRTWPVTFLTPLSSDRDANCGYLVLYWSQFASQEITLQWSCLFYAEGFHSGYYGHHMGIHCNIACASIEIQIIGNLHVFWTLEVNCHCILVAAQYCFLIKKIWLYCSILNLHDCPEMIRRTLGSPSGVLSYWPANLKKDSRVPVYHRLTPGKDVHQFRFFFPQCVHQILLLTAHALPWSLK